MGSFSTFERTHVFFYYYLFFTSCNLGSAGLKFGGITGVGQRVDSREGGSNPFKNRISNAKLFCHRTRTSET